VMIESFYRQKLVAHDIELLAPEMQFVETLDRIIYDELILGKAHAEAREIQRRSYSENERLIHESRRVRAQLVEALSAFDDPQPEDAAEEVEPEATQESDSGEERSWYGVPDADAA